jgi:adenylate cyclase
MGSALSSLKHFRITISAKLIALIALLLVVSISAVVYLSGRMYISNDKENIKSFNADSTKSLQVQTREIMGSLAEKMRYLGTFLLQDPVAGARSPLFKDFFANDKEFMAFLIYDSQNGGWKPFSRVLSQEFALTGDTDGSKAMQALAANKAFSIDRLISGESQVGLIKLVDSSQVIAVGVPLNGSFTAISFIRPAKLSSVFNDDARGSSFLVDHQGNILAHTDATRVGQNASNLPVVKELLTGGKPQNAFPYTDPATRETRLASYRLVGFAGLGVVSELPEGLAYQAANKMKKRATYLGLIILFIAFWAGFMYSGTITRPITKLVEAAQKIASGDFKINLKAKGRDEIAHLSSAFNEMAKGLEERDRVKETFNKFHNKEIAEKLLSGEVKLGGERKEATVFFSDVRGFTAMSESMQPEEVVEMLNEYMTRMVSIVRAHHGIVDKYVGDAIMALWGVPLGNEDDLCNAVRTCLEMRKELAKLNVLRISRGQSPLKIGMGLNVGPVIAGNIGSVEKMEYTVIGDTVNLASRMESMTKEYGTDFLIPQAIYDRVKDKFIFEKCKSARVKGKSTTIEVYKVKGYYNQAGQEVIIETPYSSYESEKSDKVVHDETAEDSLDRTFIGLERLPPRNSMPETPIAAEPAPLPVLEPSSVMDKVNRLKEQFPDLASMQAIDSPEITGEVDRATIPQDQGFFLKMLNEVMGPFTRAEVQNGIFANEFPADALFSTTQDGDFKSIAEFSSPSSEIERPDITLPGLVMPATEEVTGTQLAPDFSPLEVVAEGPSSLPSPESAPPEFILEPVLTEAALAAEAPPIPPPAAAPKAIEPPPFRHSVAVAVAVEKPIEMPVALVLAMEAPQNPPPLDAPFAPPPAPAGPPEIAPPPFPAADVTPTLESPPTEEVAIELPSLEEKPAA